MAASTLRALFPAAHPMRIVCIQGICALTLIQLTLHCQFGIAAVDSDQRNSAFIGYQENQQERRAADPVPGAFDHSPQPRHDLSSFKIFCRCRDSELFVLSTPHGQVRHATPSAPHGAASAGAAKRLRASCSSRQAPAAISAWAPKHAHSLHGLSTCTTHFIWRTAYCSATGPCTPSHCHAFVRPCLLFPDPDRAQPEVCPPHGAAGGKARGPGALPCLPPLPPRACT